MIVLLALGGEAVKGTRLKGESLHNLNEGEKSQSSCEEPCLAIDDDSPTFIQQPIILEKGAAGEGDVGRP